MDLSDVFVPVQSSTLRLYWLQNSSFSFVVVVVVVVVEIR